MRTLLVLLAVPLIATFAPLSLYRAPAIPERAWVRFEPVALDPEDRQRTRVGRLVLEGGWALSSNDPRFGGISAMHVEGDQLLALSDAGMMFRFALPEAGTAGELSVRQLAEGPGSPLRKQDRDTEAMAVEGDQAWLAFERRNVVWRYGLETLDSTAAAAPSAMREWNANTGAEGMVRLPDGRFLVLAERVLRDGTSEAVLFKGDPALAQTKSVQLRYRPPKGFRITDVAALPGGGLLFLNRRWSFPAGFSSSVALLRRPRLEEGEVLAPSEIARLAPPLASDNFEALSVTQENGRTIVWLASDDNFLALQRSLLLKLRLEP